MIVPYSKYPSTTPGFSSFWRPDLVVRFIVGSKSARINALVDSGADSILLNSNYAVHLGLKWDSGLKTSMKGISGNPIDAYLHDAEIEIANLKNSRVKVIIGFVDIPDFNAVLG